MPFYDEPEYNYLIGRYLLGVSRRRPPMSRPMPPSQYLRQAFQVV